ncbi:MAG: hypothetical protein J0H50_03340 [Xanthomonadales bacterium]|mgnify:CR=1 FL=1|nr:hypothetical protein [Xanthomonadales bacterium]
MLLVSPSNRSQHPLLRVVSMLLGLVLLGLLLLFGLVAAGILLVGGGILLAWRQWKKLRAQPAAARAGSSRPSVLEGEFVVLSSERRSTR